jgi:fructan beta-fructosidase
VDRGKDFYATQNWTNVPAGRRLWIAWMNNWQYAPTRSRLTRGAVL